MITPLETTEAGHKCDSPGCRYEGNYSYRVKDETGERVVYACFPHSLILDDAAKEKEAKV